MTFLVPLMLFGWPILAIVFFFRWQPHRVVLVVVIGGVLFLPQVGYDLQGLPPYTKQMAIALGLILGGRLSGARKTVFFQFSKYDLPMLVWCLCPLASSFSNGLGLYDGLAAVFTQAVTWGIPYLAGRTYFSNIDSMRDLCLGIIIGGMLYIPLCLYEIRMSPQLSNIFYGFFPHSFAQHVRYGGFRPIVFMQHGLMVALWMAVSTTVSYWLWRSKEITYVKGIPLFGIVIVSIITTILCKTAGGWLALVIGCGMFSLYKIGGSTFRLQLLLLVVPLYIAVRLSGFVTVHDVTTAGAYIFDEQRISSLEYRLDAEELYCSKAFERPLLGWGGYNRNRVIDPNTGQLVKKAIDSLWLIVFSSKGLVGLFSFVGSMLIGPWLVLRFISHKMYGSIVSPHIPVVLSLCVILFMIDSLMNGMINPIYVLISGALVSYYEQMKDNEIEHQLADRTA